MKRLLLLLALLAWAVTAGAAGKHPFTLADLHRIRDVSEPALSPDGIWLAFTVGKHNLDLDRSVSEIWRASYDGKQRSQLTFDDKSSSYQPQWSPDGKWLAFLSDRGEDETVQVWRMASDGGEAQQLTEFKGGVSDFVWAPDSRQLALIVADAPDEPESAAPNNKPGAGQAASAKTDEEDKPAKPIVIDRYQFKDDSTGYLTDKRAHLYVFDIATKLATVLTPGNHDEWSPAWAPDGRHIAYVTKRGDDPDRHLNSDIYLIEPRADSKERQLTTFKGSDLDPYWESRPSWSPDSRQIAYLQSGDDHWIYYAPWQLAVIDVDSGKSRIPAPIDRCFYKPKWAADGKSVYALIEESRNTYLSRIALDDGKVEQLTSGSRFDADFDMRGNRIALLTGDDANPPELFALESNALRPLSLQNTALVADVQFQPAEDFSFTASDGTRIDGLLMKPVGYKPGSKVKTIVRVHGGPVYQFSHEFLFEWQWYAAKGYAVIGAEPRGSSGRGFDFAKAIYADWGNLDSADVLGAVDHVVAMGVADPERLAIGGWSYGSILTDQVIVRDPRFKAAWSGAGSGNALGMYGLDEYIRETELELGKPWENPDAYLRLSAPFLHADRIKTPTLFLCAEKDFNVPCEGAEQMYQALRSLNTPTRLVIYPDQHHDLDVPSYLADRLQRITDWIDRYLK
jgi:dipeptidyl aminopeptidase/acylaminoacyl peptidase